MGGQPGCCLLLGVAWIVGLKQEGVPMDIWRKRPALFNQTFGAALRKILVFGVR